MFNDKISIILYLEVLFKQENVEIDLLNGKQDIDLNMEIISKELLNIKENEIYKLSVKLNKENKEINDLKKENEHFHKEINNLKKENEHFHKEINNLKKENTELIKEINNF